MWTFPFQVGDQDHIVEISLFYTLICRPPVPSTAGELQAVRDLHTTGRRKCASLAGRMTTSSVTATPTPPSLTVEDCLEKPS